MTELTLTPRSPLAGILPAGRQGRMEGEAGLTVSERQDLALASVIARKGEARALAALVRSAYGLDLPFAPRFAGGHTPDDRPIAFIWSGPGQWLATGEGGREFVGELRAALGRRAMIADQSDGRCVLRLAGRNVRQVLAKGVPIDLHPRAFGPGDTALTTAEHVAVQIWQLDDNPSFEIAFARSLAESFWSWLQASAAEFGFEVLPGR